MSTGENQRGWRMAKSWQSEGWWPRVWRITGKELRDEMKIKEAG